MIFLSGGTLDLNAVLQRVVVLQREQAEDGRAAQELLMEREVNSLSHPLLLWTQPHWTAFLLACPAWQPETLGPILTHTHPRLTELP